MRQHVLDASCEADPFEIRAEPRVLHPAAVARPRRRPLPWLRMVLVSSAMIAALVYLAEQRETESEEAAGHLEPIPAAVLLAPPPVWQPLIRPAALYALDGPEGKALPVSLEARRHASGGREDTLVFGHFGDPGHGRLSIARGVFEPDTGRFYIDLVRRAAEAGLSVVRSAQSRTLATKFGTVEAAAVTLAETSEQACLAFRFTHPEISFGFRGWLCGSEDRPVSEAQVVCLIDRLALINAGEDPPLKVLFAQADRQRACAPAAKVAAARRS